jgi:hypothetical protein
MNQCMDNYMGGYETKNKSSGVRISVGKIRIGVWLNERRGE